MIDINLIIYAIITSYYSTFINKREKINSNVPNRLEAKKKDRSISNVPCK